jgi:hypothetical protein
MKVKRSTQVQELLNNARTLIASLVERNVDAANIARIVGVSAPTLRAFIARMDAENKENTVNTEES